MKIAFEERSNSVRGQVIQISHILMVLVLHTPFQHPRQYLSTIANLVIISKGVT